MQQHVKIHRRGFLAGAGSLLGLAACVHLPLRPPRLGPLIDVHCHVFNASDMPVNRFIRYAFLHNYPGHCASKARKIEDADFVDALIKLLTSILRVNSAPTAKQEYAVLTRRAAIKPSNASISAAGEITIGIVGNFLAAYAQSRKTVPGPDRSGTGKLASAILEAGGAGRRVMAGTPDEAARIARRAFLSPSRIGVYLRWFNLFTLYRHKLVDHLASEIAKQGSTPVLITPALIDMSKWLGESVKSSMRDQVKVMGLLSRRANGPAIHGYVGFDPLREVYHRRKGSEASSLALVREALTEHGFIGVKLYPPMGFRASRNVRPYPETIEKELGLGLSRDLDRALDDLYRLCVDLDAPILAHAYASYGASCNSELRADPAFWAPVFEDHQRLSVCLAHFGRFDIPSHGKLPEGLPQTSWEWRLGEEITKWPSQRIFADMSYFSEAFTQDRDERKQLARNLRDWIDKFDEPLNRLVFGTDWMLLGRERDFDRYISEVDHFLAQDCGIDAPRRNRFFVENAIDFLGLRAGGGARSRLLQFYDSHRLDPSRLPS